MKKLFFIVLLIAGILLMPLYTMGQVTIGSGTPPAPYSLLQIKDKDPVNPSLNNETATKGGLILPRVNLVHVNTLEPFISDSTTVTDYQKVKLLHTGMIVYNTANSGNALTPGVFQWDGKKWKSIESNDTSELDIKDCSKISVSGIYYAGSALSSSNYITLPLNVTSAGRYSLLAKSGNGYYFQASGTFPSPGVYTVQMEGLGVPSAVKTDQLTITNNGVDIKETGNNTCSTSINVRPATVSYTIDCSGIQSEGTPMESGQSLDGSEGIRIPITVENGGTAIFTTSTNNGIYYSINQVIDETTTELILKASGMPSKAGTYTYNFTTNGAKTTICSFNVKVTTTVGSFANPAKNCLAILTEDPTTPDGEYWINNGSGSPVKTLCDMTNGGYTLLWSYSEKRAYTGGAPYGATNSMNIAYSAYLNANAPRNNVITNDGATITYTDYRLPLAAMQNVRAANPGDYRVRITNNPTDIKDSWAVNNFFRITPKTSFDYISNSSSSCTESNIPTKGKLFGYVYDGTSNTPTYNGIAVSGDICPYINTDYSSHWDAGRRFTSTTGKTTLPVIPGGQVFDAYYFNDLFGFFGEFEINHHFGKCTNSGTGDDYNFSIATCASSDLRPHSFNNGEGRYLQWFVK